MASKPPLEPSPTLGGPLSVRRGGDAPWQKCHCLLVDNTIFLSPDPARPASAEPLSIDQETSVIFNDTDESPDEAQFSLGDVAFRGPRCDIVFWVFAVNLCRRCDTKYTREQFKSMHNMGSGFFGEIELVKQAGTDEVFTLKTVHKHVLFHQERNVKSMQEVEKELMSVIPNHPFIAGLEFCFQTHDSFYMGLEYPAGGELIQYISSMNVVPLDDATLYTAEIALALDYLHKNNIVVRDLNPEKVFLDKNGHVVLADFGMSKRLKGTTNTVCGPPEFQAPEIIREEHYGFAVDWWALGIMLYLMTCGCTPFHADDGDFNLSQRILNDEPMLDLLTPKLAVDLIKGLLEKNPKDRLSFEQIRRHQFFDKFDWERVLKKDYTPTGFRDTCESESALFGQCSRPRQGSAQRTVKSRDQSSLYIEAFSFGGSGSVGDVNIEMSSSSEVNVM